MGIKNIQVISGGQYEGQQYRDAKEKEQRREQQRRKMKVSSSPSYTLNTPKNNDSFEKTLNRELDKAKKSR